MNINIEPNQLYQAKIYSPYDGCYWCWEFVYIDENCEQHYIKFGKAFKEEGYERLKYKCEHLLEESDKVFSCNIKDEKDLMNFLNEIAEMDRETVANWFEENTETVLEATCPKCNTIVPITCMRSTGYKGDGGIGVIFLDYICDECYANGLCEICGEYSDDIQETSDGRYCCEFCRDKECAWCGEKVDQTTFDEYGVCTECQNELYYQEALAEYRLKIKHWKIEKKEQLMFKGCGEIAKPVFDIEKVKEELDNTILER